MTGRAESLVEPLSRFVLEVLPWALSAVIGLYLAWGFWSAPAPAAGPDPVARMSDSHMRDGRSRISLTLIRATAGPTAARPTIQPM
jgi:hypothetical protein